MSDPSGEDHEWDSNPGRKLSPAEAADRKLEAMDDEEINELAEAMRESQEAQGIALDEDFTNEEMAESALYLMGLSDGKMESPDGESEWDVGTTWMTWTGERVEDDDAQAGDRIQIESDAFKSEEVVLVPYTGHEETCTFCDNTEEVYRSDYKLAPEEDPTTELGWACHACVRDAPILERQALSVSMGEAYHTRTQFLND